jgi:hypothetical protein
MQVGGVVFRSAKTPYADALFIAMLWLLIVGAKEQPVVGAVST